MLLTSNPPTPPSPGSAADSANHEWMAQVSYFKAVKTSLLHNPAYRGKYVAIHQQAVVDVDEDKFKLYDRTLQKYGVAVILIMKVEDSFSPAHLKFPQGVV